MATSGTESIWAVARPVTRFVAPGPLVAGQYVPQGIIRQGVVEGHDRAARVPEEVLDPFVE
jgi:hypothetical protein